MYAKWNPKDVEFASTHFKAALEFDPNHAESMLCLADCLGFLATTGFIPQMEAWKEVEVLIKKALFINNDLPNGHYQLVNLLFFSKGDYEGSFKAASKAIALNSNFGEAHQYLSFLYILAGDAKNAKKTFRKRNYD